MYKIIWKEKFRVNRRESKNKKKNKFCSILSVAIQILS